MKRFLIVGEKRDFVDWVRQQLEAEQEWVAISATSSDVGLELALQLKPHLILVDTPLTGPKGLAFCRRLRRDWETHEIPLLLLLDATPAEGQALILKLGAEDYLRKPIVPQELVLKTRALIRRRQSSRLPERGLQRWLSLYRFRSLRCSNQWS